MSQQVAHRPGGAEPAGTEAKAPLFSNLSARLFSGSGGALLGLIALFIILSFASPFFLTSRNLINILDQVTVLGILSVGATAVIITGGIDLSVGALAGSLNGLGITYAKLPPFIATLAMLSIARGLANLITDGQQIVGYPEWFFNLSSERYLGFFSVTLLVVAALYLAAWAWLKYRASGRSIYAIGGGAEVARLAGIHVKKVTIWVYVFAGALAGLGGIALASRLDSSQPSAGVGYELDVIAAVVIGGASLNGGVGRIGGTIIGVLLIGVLRNGLNLLGVSPFIQQIVIGLVIAIAVMADVLRRKRS